MSEIIKLTNIKTNQYVTLFDIEGSMQESIMLAEMGIIGSIPIRVLRNIGNGPLLIEVRDTQLMIGRGLASKIVVTMNG